MDSGKATGMTPLKRALSWVSHAAHGAARRPANRRTLFNAIRLRRPEVAPLLESRELQFLAYAFSRRAQSKSQILQDLWVCFELEERRNGFFVEFGATDGLTNSNTWLLENRFGWNGVLAEPNPFWRERLTENRSAQIEFRCVAARSGEVVTFLATDDADPELSGIATFSGGDHFAQVRSAGRRLDIETVSLNDMLEAHRAPHRIDYMSIDTEGSEYEILSNFDFSKHRVDLISVEQNKETESRIQALLEGLGYIRVFQEYSQWDGWYVAPPESSKLISLLEGKAIDLGGLDRRLDAAASSGLAET
jgi:FkbM family methyltransferase